MNTNINENPYYKEVLDYINTNDLMTLENGKHQIDGDNAYVIITDADLRPVDQAKLEVHNKYVDLQIPLSIEESFGIKKRNECTMPDGEMDIENDIMFYNDKIETVLTVHPGEQITFDPETAHAPLIGKGKTHKAIFKIRSV